jgi:peptidoglycan/xylan/chitin deacetylase (PgdA/CDA1 family)
MSARPRGIRKRTAICLVGAAALVAGLLQFVALPAGAAGQTVVSLTFDNDSISQYTLGYLQALQPHGAHGTFFVNSGTVSGGASFMTWAQLGGRCCVG